jgi:hypothetical protein
MFRKFIYASVLIGGGLVICLAVLVFLFSTRIDNWLSEHSPVRPDILIVEGWVSGNALEAAREEFLKGEYKILVTTGGPLSEAFNMSRDGDIQFDLLQAGISWADSDTVKIVLYAFGEPAMGENARFTLIHKNDTIGRGYTAERMERYIFPYFVGNRRAEMIRVVYDNDFYTDREDRNLHVWKLAINGNVILARSEHARYVRRQGGETIVRPLYHKSLSEEKAWFLSEAGIDSNVIIPLAVPETRLFRTFSDAVTVSEWLRVTGQTYVAVNVFTEGNHARRSHTLYRYALPESVEVGVVGTARPDFYQSDRLDFAFGRLSTFRQLAAYIYTRVFFNHRWHYRRISKRTGEKNQQ